MSGMLIIVLAERDGEPHICDFTPGGGPVTVDSLADIPAEWNANAEEVAVVVPGTHALARAVDLPARTETQARAALPFLLEDELASDAENLHLVLGPRLSDNRRLVGAVRSTLVQKWLGELIEAGIAPTLLVPDFLALPAAPASAAIAESGDRTIVRLGDEGGFSIEKDLLDAILPEMLTTANIQSLDVYGDGPGTPLPDEAWGGREINLHLLANREGLCALFRQGLSGGTVMNFLQGEFAARKSLAVNPGPLRMAAMLLALLGAGYLALVVSQGWRYQQMAQQATAQTEAVFRQAFPDVGRVVNPRVQLRNRLAALRAGDGDAFLKLTDILFESVGQIDSVEIESLRFDQDRRAISADLVYPNFADMERIRQAVSAQGGRLEEGASRQRGARIVGDVIIRMAE